MSQAGQLGGGSGKGGGAGGTIREAGGSLGTAGASKEEAYFRKVQADQLEAMRKAVQASKHSSPTVEQRSAQRNFERHGADTSAHDASA